jgi:hypothetical protein
MATHYHNKSDDITALLFNGTFASPLPGINESLATSQGHLTAALSAPIINAHRAIVSIPQDLKIFTYSDKL